MATTAQDLAGRFTGTLADFARTVNLDGAGPQIPSAQLLDVGALRQLVDRFDACNPGGDRRAVVSMWSQWHFAAVIVPSVVATLLGRVHLPIALGQATFALYENGCTSGVVLTPGTPLQPSPASGGFDALIEGHLAPLIGNLAAPFGVSPKLLWTNAGGSLAWSVQQCAMQPGVDEAALAEARAILTAPLMRSGTRNLLYGALKPSPLVPFEQCQRRVCCLRYLLPGVADCGSYCPLSEDARAQRRA